ncbi:hypothetical protein RvY_14676 [Ramazzottius varieornatus]|uniref:Immunoglobulin-binding protein 1 n=1 Tax=Ramazzottius varieornatus TaxID=947166 RepID=A0A1D1VS50_RAMVA|nr:hypothetical protein RvY_14676 [Ramazzottius varieornatus]
MDAESLSELFTKGQKAFQRLVEGAEESSSSNVEELIKSFETLTKYVSVLGLFSRNENIEEIATTDLRFLLLPAYLAKLTLRLNDHRYDRLEAAEVYIRNFLGLCKDYEVPGHAAIPKSALKPNDAVVENDNTTRLQKTPQDLLNEASNKRAAKIAALKQRMDHQETVRELQRRLDQGSADDDVQRAFYQNMIMSWVLDLLEELPSIQEEKRMLDHRKKLANGEHIEEVISNASKQKRLTKPIVLVKNEIQKNVFGAGYPSLPTHTVEEFYRELVEEGALPAPGSKAAASMNYTGPTQEQLEADDVKKEQDEEKDDPDYLTNTRAYDDWKDEHRRGWGNRIGQG